MKSIHSIRVIHSISQISLFLLISVFQDFCNRIKRNKHQNIQLIPALKFVVLMLFLCYMRRVSIHFTIILSPLIWQVSIPIWAAMFLFFLSLVVWPEFLSHRLINRQKSIYNFISFPFIFRHERDAPLNFHRKSVINQFEWERIYILDLDYPPNQLGFSVYDLITFWLCSSFFGHLFRFFLNFFFWTRERLNRFFIGGGSGSKLQTTTSMIYISQTNK